MIVNWAFDANQHEPNQGFGIHPPALKVPFTLTNTEIKETTAGDGGYLSVEFTSPLGVIRNIYNINNKSPKAVEIAMGQLSALCRAVNIYQINGNNECAALRGGKGLMDVGYQKGEEPDPAFPDRKGYTELKRVYDMAGNEPGKVAAQPQTTAAVQGQPMVAQQGGGWGQPAQNPNPAQQAPQGQGGAWQPGGQAAGASPPWGSRT